MLLHLNSQEDPAELTIMPIKTVAYFHTGDYFLKALNIKAFFYSFYFFLRNFFHCVK